MQPNYAQPVKPWGFSRPQHSVALRYVDAKNKLVCCFNRLEDRMRSVRTTLLAGIAAVAVAGSAWAAGSHVTFHHMATALPGGGTAQIEYAGNVAPKVMISRDTQPLDAFFPRVVFSPGFADMQQISAQMDRGIAQMQQQMNTMLHEVNSEMPALTAPKGLYQIGTGNLPRGMQSISVVSTASGNGTCMRSVEITTSANGKRNVVRHSSGDCGAGAAAAHAAPAAPAKSI
jgi:hypothetical protein